MEYITYALFITGCIIFIRALIGFMIPKLITSADKKPRSRLSIILSGTTTASLLIIVGSLLLPTDDKSITSSNSSKSNPSPSPDQGGISRQQLAVKGIVEQFFTIRASTEELRSRKLKAIMDAPSSGNQASIIAHSYGLELEEHLRNELNISIPDHLEESTKNYLLEAMQAHNQWASNTVKKGLIFNSQENSNELSSNIAKYSRLEASLLASALGTVNLSMTCDGPGLCEITIEE